MSAWRLPARAASQLPLAVGVIGLSAVVAFAHRGVYLLALAVVPVVAVVLRRPQRGVLVLAALAPLDGLLLPFHLPKYASYWKEGLVVVIVVAAFLAKSDAPRNRRLPPWLGALLVFLALGVVSALAHLGSQALFGVKLEFFYMLLVLAIWRQPLTAVDRDHLVTIFMVAGFLNAFYGCVQELLGQARLASLGYQYNTAITTAGGFLKAFGTVGTAHGMGLYTGVVLLAGLSAALRDPHRLRNRVFLYLTPIYAAGLVLSLTRAAYMGFGVGLLYLGLRRYRQVLLVVPLVVLLAVWTPSHYLSTALSPKSGQQRLSTWTAVPGLVVHHPVGEGIGSAGSAIDKVKSGGLLSSGTAPIPGQTATVSIQLPDNYYVLVLAELGLGGLWIFLLLLVGIFWQFHTASRPRRATSADPFAEIAATTTLAAIVASLSETYFELYPADLTFWLIVGVGAAMLAEPRVRARGGLRRSLPALPAASG